MPANNNEQLRYQILDKCLSAQSTVYTFTKLKDTINSELEDRGYPPISDRTLRQDISYLKEHYSAPIKAFYDCGKPPYYRYDDDSFVIFKLMSTTEAGQLIDSLNLLNRFAGMPKMDWLEDFIHKIESEYKINRNSKAIVGFDRIDEFKGQEFFSPIFEAIVSKRALTIVYKPFYEKEPSTITLSPHYLRQYNNRWYVLGYAENLEYIPNYAFDRIVKVSESKSEYRESSIDYDENYFNDIFGVTIYKDRKKERILLQVSPDYEEYFTSGLLYDHIKPVKGNPHQYHLDIRPNYELLTFLLSHADKIKVLSSETHYVENKVKERIAEACKLWGIEPKSDKAEGSKA